VALDRALIDLGIGLWLIEPPAKSHAHGLKYRASAGVITPCISVASSGCGTAMVVRSSFTPAASGRWNFWDATTPGAS